MKWLRLAGVLGALLITTSGCAIDSAQLITDVVQAGLTSVSSSLVNALSVYLAGN